MEGYRIGIFVFFFFFGGGAGGGHSLKGLSLKMTWVGWFELDWVREC